MRVLIIGYGKMGRIHGKHLAELGVPWEYHDPHVPGGVGLDRLASCTHAIIATPIDTHYDVYRRLDDFPGRILLEKPVVTRAEHLYVLDDPRVFPGMCERFNPAVAEVRRLHPRCRSIEFVRTGAVAKVEDIAIHDLDLCCVLHGWEEVPEWHWRDGRLHADDRDGKAATFCWTASTRTERWLRIENGGKPCFADLLAQSVDGRQIERDWPVSRELTSFLRGDRLDAGIAHEWLAEILTAS